MQTSVPVTKRRVNKTQKWAFQVQKWEHLGVDVREIPPLKAIDGQKLAFKKAPSAFIIDQEVRFHRQQDCGSVIDNYSIIHHGMNADGDNLQH